MTKVKILIFILLISTKVFSQLTKEERNNTVADCKNAVEIHHYKQTYIQFSGSYGYIDELNDINPLLNEVNSVWIKLNPHLNGEMTIEFQPIENYNFEYYLFKDPVGNFCANDFENIKLDLLIKQGEIIFSENEKINTVSSIKIDVNNEMTTGFYLLLHTKEIHQKTLKLNFFLEGEIETEPIYVQNYKKNATLKSVKIKLRDKYSNEGVLGNVTISGLKMDNLLFLGSDFIFDAYNTRNCQININAEGYFLYNENLKILNGNDNLIKIELEPLAPGKKLKLEGLSFKLNSKDFLPISYLALKRLLEFMIINSSVRIEIQGHVNAPGNKTSSKAKKLSEGRAKNAYLYLVRNGVDKERITYIGKGATEMINPNPKTHKEEELNRRVEILITG